MKLFRVDNPLRTIVQLDEEEIQKLYNKVRAEHHDDIKYHYDYTLKAGKMSGHEHKISIDGIEESVQKWMDEFFDELLYSLQSTHIGDCTAFPATCDKCWMESFLGISTFPYSKSVGNNLFELFKDDISIEEAIKTYEDDIKTPFYKNRNKWFESMSDIEWNELTKRWQTDRQITLEVLKRHRELIRV